MSSLSSATPARLTALATTRLPRLVLIGLAALYILVGLFERDPWKTDDVVGLASMITAAAQGGASWLFPHIGTSSLASMGPLTNWVGGLFILMFGPAIGEIGAARLATLFWLLLCLGTLWYATYLAGRRAEAQPLALPFGGEPKEGQYGRLLADLSLLFLIATVGIILRTHETSIAPALLAFQAVVILGVMRLLDKPWHATPLIVLAIAASGLTHGASAAAPLAVGVLLAIASKPLRKKFLQVLIAVGLGLIPIAIWLQLVGTIEPDWARNWWFYNGIHFNFGRLSEHLNPIRDLPWFLWPTWPLAAVAIWNWRKSLFAPHIWVPTAFIVAQSITILAKRDAGELDYISLTVPCAMLAAFSIPTLRRALVNALDWFALMYFSVTGACIWLGWFTQQTGWPRGLATNIARQTVGYDGWVSPGAIAMALVVSAAWVAAIVWRLRLHPKAAWRGALLCAGGLTSTWILLVLLWMPTVDYVRSYRTMSAELALSIEQAQIDAGKPMCVNSIGLSLGAQASLYVFDRIDISNGDHCPLLLQQTTAERLHQGIAGFDRNSRILWTGSRGADRFDRYRLLLLMPQS